jgi:hypothetical protein
MNTEAPEEESLVSVEVRNSAADRHQWHGYPIRNLTKQTAINIVLVT